MVTPKVTNTRYGFHIELHFGMNNTLESVNKVDMVILQKQTKWEWKQRLCNLDANNYK